MDHRKKKKQKSSRLRIAAIVMVAVIVLLAVLLIALSAGRNASSGSGLSQFVESFFGAAGKKTFEAEVDRIIAANHYEDEIDHTIHSSGTFGRMEEAVKNYCTEYAELLRSVRGTLKDEDYQAIVTIENIEADSPAFENSRRLLDELRQSADTSVKRLKQMRTAEEAMGAVASLDLNNYFADVYRKAVCEKLLPQWMYADAELDDALASIDASVSRREEVLDFLSAEHDNWTISGGKIAFLNDELLARYQELTGNL